MPAELLRHHKVEIIKIWEKRVRKEIPAANASSNLALRNQLPNVLDDLASILEKHIGIKELSQHEKFEEIIQNSLEHGRHRATSTHYTVKQLIQEYILFHRTLTEFLVKHEKYSSEVGIILKYSLETAMLNSASSFTDSLQEMREKLVGTLAHDIRTPISAAHFALDILQPDIDRNRFEKLKKMGLKSVKKSLELLENILDSITVKAGEGVSLNFEETDILKEIKWVHNEASEIYSNRIDLKCKEEEITGIFDGTAIRRVVENLVTNAVKYGSREAPISIIVEDHHEKEMVAIKVHNYGNPIAEEERENIFKFLNKDRSRNPTKLESWGMGLTLVKSVASAHGGDVCLVSNEIDGTTFSLSLYKNANHPGKVKTEVNFKKQG